MSNTYTHKRGQTTREWAAKVWDSKKLIVTKGRHDVGRGGVLLCCPLFLFYYTHEFSGLVFVIVCVRYAMACALRIYSGRYSPLRV